MAEEKTLNGEATAEQINRWKMQHRKVVSIEIDDEGEKHIGYFKRPSMETMAAVNKIGKTDEIKSAQTLFNGCWLGGSEAIGTDAVLFTACMAKLNVVFAQVSAEIKNL